MGSMGYGFTGAPINLRGLPTGNGVNPYLGGYGQQAGGTPIGFAPLGYNPGPSQGVTGHQNPTSLEPAGGGWSYMPYGGGVFGGEGMPGTGQQVQGTNGVGQAPGGGTNFPGGNWNRNLFGYAPGGGTNFGYGFGPVSGGKGAR